MKVSLRALSLLPCMAFMLAATPIAHADSISVTVYENITNPGNAADTSSANETNDYGTFNVTGSGINYQSDLSSYSDLSVFLNNPTFLTTHGAFNPHGSVNNIFMILSGSVFLNAGTNSFIVGHDDGIVLKIPGISYDTGLSEAGPTGLVTTPFDITNPLASGLYSFTLQYTECCGAPADLLFEVNGAPVGGTAPEPNSLILLGTGILAAAGMARRRIFA